jgi:ribosomal protein S4
MYTYRQLKKIGKRAKKKAGVFIQNFLSVVESKLPSYLYRSSLFATVFDSLDFLKKGNV